MTMDRILIEDLSVRCIIGINDEERRERQDVVLNLALYADLEKAGKSDRFEDAVDYRSVKKRVFKMVEHSNFFLIEALAEAVAGLCLEQAGVQEVSVKVEKPAALRFARSVGVEITRSKKTL